MNFENRIENFAIAILNHRIKVVFSAIILIIMVSSGILRIQILEFLIVILMLLGIGSLYFRV